MPNDKTPTTTDLITVQELIEQIKTARSDTSAAIAISCFVHQEIQLRASEQQAQRDRIYETAKARGADLP